MLMKFFNILSVLFCGIVLGTAFGAAIAFVGYDKVLKNDGYGLGVRKTKETEETE